MSWTRIADHGRLGVAMIAGPSAALLSLASIGAALAEDGFPAASPESVGMSSAALAELAETVQSYVDRDMVVGAELLVIKDRQTVLHEAFGWRDREADEPMGLDTLFNVRSMTKPVTGAAAQMLIDDGSLALDDRVADFLPAFETGESGDITIEQLLTHTSGLPLTILASAYDYESLQAMADAAGEGGPEFEPGSKFWYSDTGTDVLGAVVERVSGASLDAFVTERLLGPLGMRDTYYAGDPDDPRASRIADLYVGRVGGWTSFWEPDDEPFYPYAWGSQTLYGTPADYARFLAMWMDGGMVDGSQLLSPEAVARTLTPSAPMGSLGSDAPYPTRFDGLTAYHGQLALLHVDEASMDGSMPAGVEPTIIGYSGSDGTIAWAWPKLDLMILYFTQSRGGATPIRLEDEIERLLLDPPAEADTEVPAEYADYLGTYTADFAAFRNEPFEVLWRDGGLALDIPSQFIFELDRVGDTERWTLGDDPNVSITFVRDGADVVRGLQLAQGGATFDVPKGAPEPQPEIVVQVEDVEPYLGWFREEGTGREIEVVFEAGELALRIPETDAPIGLFPPDEDGGWRVRLNPSVAIFFDQQDGVVGSYVARGPAGESVFQRIDEPD